MTATVAETLARAIERSRGEALPAKLLETIEMLLVDIAGLCVAARGTDYVRAALDGWEASGLSTAIGHARPLDAA